MTNKLLPSFISPTLCQGLDGSDQVDQEAPDIVS